MSLIDQANLASNQTFQGLVAASAVQAAINITSETVTDQQTLTMVAVTAGTFTLTFLGQTTAALQWNSSASAIQTALNALSGVGAGGVECTGGPLPATGVVVNFLGATVQGAQPPMTHTDTLTGGTATVTHTTVGTWVANHTKRAALASKIVANPSGYGQLMATGVASAAAVQADFPAPNYTLTATAAQATTDIGNQIAGVWNAYT